jgi:hypothetical protein
MAAPNPVVPNPEDILAEGLAGLGIDADEAAENRGAEFMQLVRNQSVAMDRLATHMHALTGRFMAGTGGEAGAVPALGGVAREGKYSLKFTTYSGELGDVFADFLRFEMNIRLVTKVMGYKMPTVATAILGQLRGRALDIGRTLQNRETEYETLDDFLTKLRSLFVSPAYKEKARAAFLSRKQGPEESIIVFHGTLSALFEAAYEERDRQAATLIRQFVSGLRNPEIVKQLIIAKPETYQAALESALRWEGDLDVVALTLQWQRKGGQGVLNHSIAGTPSASNGGGGEPMDIGAMRYGRGRGNRGKRARPTGRHVRSRSMTRVNRGTNVFNLQTPPATRGRAPTRVAMVTFRRSSSAPRNGSGLCFNCRKEGHWMRDCPLPRRNPQRGYRRGTRSVSWTRPRSQTPGRSGSKNRVMALNPGTRKPRFYAQERRESQTKN